jgi:hypothetical protein
MLHALIVVPYYFLSALALLPLLILAARLLRLTVSVNTLVGIAIGLALASIVIPLAADWVDLDAFSGRPLLVLVLASLLLTAVDAALLKHLPLPLDEELRDL